MASEDNVASESDPQISFKVKTSSDGNHSITMSQSATVLDLKTKLSGDEYEKVPADRQRLIYSGRVLKNEDHLSKYDIKPGNTIHMVKSAQSNIAQNPASASTTTAARAAPGVPTNMAAGTANNPLAQLTGARYAGHMALPGPEMFGADGGMGAPPSEEAMAQMLDDPNVRQSLNEVLNNPAMVDMMLNSMPGLRDNPQARQMLHSPEFRRLMTDPAAMRQAAQLQRMIRGGGASAGGFPAPGVTDTTPAGGAGANTTPGQAPPLNPFAMFGGAGVPAGANPFASMFNSATGGQGTPSQTPPAAGPTGQTPNSASPPPSADRYSAMNAASAQRLAALFGGEGNAGAQAPPPDFGMPQMTPDMMQEAMRVFQGQGGNDLFGGLGGFGGAANPPAPADTRPPEERYADQLRQLNDMGFFDFDRNVEALRRSGGSVQGAIEQLLS